MHKTKLAVVALSLTAAFLINTGCATPTAHPNQINAFDGASYDSLTLAHGALSSLRAEVSPKFPQYTPLFNQAAAAYAGAYNAYALFRTTPADTASTAVAISNLTVAVIALENAFQTDMHASPATIQQIAATAKKIRARAAGSSITISDILTELEVAASIAQTIPVLQPYSAIAAIVIEATQQALAAHSAASGQPIDLSTIQPIAAI